MVYLLSLKVEREYIISPSFTDDELTTFIEGRKKIKKTSMFTADGLPTFTEGRKRISYHRCSLTMNYQHSLMVEKR